MVSHGDGRVQHAAAEGVETIPPANSICLLVVKLDHIAAVSARVGLPAHVRQIDHRQDGGTTGQQPGGTGSARAGRTGALKGQPERIVRAALGRPHGSHERPLHHQQLPRPHGAGGLQHAARLRPPDLDGPGEVREVRQQLHRRGRGGGGTAGEVGHAASPPARQAITVDLHELKVALALPLQPLHSLPQVGCAWKVLLQLPTGLDEAPRASQRHHPELRSTRLALRGAAARSIQHPGRRVVQACAAELRGLGPGRRSASTSVGGGGRARGGSLGASVERLHSEVRPPSSRELRPAPGLCSHHDSNPTSQASSDLQSSCRAQSNSCGPATGRQLASPRRALQRGRRWQRGPQRGDSCRGGRRSALRQHGDAEGGDPLKNTF
mmetsp:Transcript_95481/g.273872  ORF Transcript_95481/g.273872 Transcript_95481/m.273872 type:complete len:381 (-) Transcript_95481:12-1154(-)